MTIKNSDRFLTAFNRIEHALQQIVASTDYIPFVRLVDTAKKHNAVVRKHEDDLRSYAELRNAIVHNRVSTEFVIAEPHDSVVTLIEEIDAMLSNQKSVGELFAKSVITFQLHDSLEKILDVIREHKYTQFPIYEGERFKGMVTTVGITYWLARSVEEGKLPIVIPTVDDILQNEKNTVYYQFIQAGRTLFEAEEIFKSGIEHGHHYQALLITEKGQPNEPLLGIMTPIDVMTH